MPISQDEIPQFGTGHACFLVFLIFVLIEILFTHTAKATEVCVLAAAQVVLAEGIVEFRKSKKDVWHKAEMNTLLCTGNQLRTRRQSRAAARLLNGKKSNILVSFIFL